MKYISIVFLLLLFSTNSYSKNWVSLDSEMTYIKTLKSQDYKSIHNGASISMDLGDDFYLLTKIATNFEFNKLSKLQLELAWMYEFYFFDLHPFIGYSGGYYLLHDNKYNHLIYFRLNGGVLFHLYDICKMLKVGTELSTYMFLGTNKYLAISIAGVFFIRMEF